MRLLQLEQAPLDLQEAKRVACCERAKRVSVEEVVSYHTEQGVVRQGLVVDLTDRGMRIRGADDQILGEPIRVIFDSPTGVLVEATGQVRWTSSESQASEFGVEFLSVHGNGDRTLKSWYSQLLAG